LRKLSGPQETPARTKAARHDARDLCDFYGRTRQGPQCTAVYSRKHSERVDLGVNEREFRHRINQILKSQRREAEALPKKLPATAKAKRTKKTLQLEAPSRIPATPRALLAVCPNVEEPYRLR
jgi:hypothetical protein